MIEAKGRRRSEASGAVANSDPDPTSPEALVQEIATFRSQLQELLRDHPGQFALVKGSEVAGVFPDHAAAIREGYRRFGIVPFLVQQIAESEPAVYLPNVVP